jgi:aspartyl/asparaginyl beta-hydroxylase (cupin superfamily)
MNWRAKIIKHRTYNPAILTFNLGLAIAYRF